MLVRCQVDGFFQNLQCANDHNSCYQHAGSEIVSNSCIAMVMMFSNKNIITMAMLMSAGQIGPCSLK
jgi:spore coat protein CotF